MSFYLTTQPMTNRWPLSLNGNNVSRLFSKTAEFVLQLQLEHYVLNSLQALKFEL